MANLICMILWSCAALMWLAGAVVYSRISLNDRDQSRIPAWLHLACGVLNGLVAVMYALLWSGGGA